MLKWSSVLLWPYGVLQPNMDCDARFLILPLFWTNPLLYQEYWVGLLHGINRIEKHADSVQKEGNLQSKSMRIQYRREGILFYVPRCLVYFLLSIQLLFHFPESVCGPKKTHSRLCPQAFSWHSSFFLTAAHEFNKSRSDPIGLLTTSN